MLQAMSYHQLGCHLTTVATTSLAHAQECHQVANNEHFCLATRVTGLFVCMLHSYRYKRLTPLHATHVGDLVKNVANRTLVEWRTNLLADLQQMVESSTVFTDPTTQKFALPYQEPPFASRRSLTLLNDATRFGTSTWADLRETIMPVEQLSTLPVYQDLPLDARHLMTLLRDKQAFYGAAVPLVCGPTEEELDPDAEECVVCLLPVPDLITTPCGHLYCHDHLIATVNEIQKCAKCRCPLTIANCFPDNHPGGGGGGPANDNDESGAGQGGSGGQLSGGAGGVGGESEPLGSN